MIKRLILSLILLAFCFSVGIGSYIYIENSATELIQDFEQVYTYMQDEQYNSANELMQQTQQKWDISKTWYNMFLDYSQFEQLEINIPLTQELIENENYEYASTKLLEIIETYNSIIHEQKISFGNVLFVY